MHGDDMRQRLPNGLTAREERFCVLLCKGTTQLQAYRQSGMGKRQKDETAAPAASRLAAKPKIVARLAELLRASTVSDLDSIGQAYGDLLQDIDSARKDENWTAVAALTRQRLQVLGMLRDNVSLTVENSAGDSELLRRLAGDDPTRLALLEQLVGRTKFDA